MDDDIRRCSECGKEMHEGYLCEECELLLDRVGRLKGRFNGYLF